jgi:hypothetical protein
LTELLLRQERGEAIDEAELARQVETAVETVVHKQLEVGIDIGNDGEQPRVAFHTYVARRMQGFGGGWVRPVRRDVTDFTDFATMWRARQQSTARPPPPQAIAGSGSDLHEAEQECALFPAVTAAGGGYDFMTATAGHHCHGYGQCLLRFS